VIYTHVRITGLAAVDAVTGMTGSHLWPAARAEALRRLRRDDQAREALRRALELAPTTPERRLLTRRLEEISPD
jgi:RNA polymerase sigma-70 factor, ECF subfamily